ncbi:MAG: T9SS type A sorting domain-containing protein [Chitinophagales bacterium]
MKKLFLLLAVVFGLSKLQAQFVIIPDPVFASWLSNNYPTCMQNNRLDTTCPAILSATSLTMNGIKVSNLSGIEYFKNLEMLECQNDSLVTIPAFPQKLLSIDVEWNNLTTLPEMPNTLLSLYCGTNPFTQIPPLPANLQRLWCHGSFLNTFPALPSSVQDLDLSTGQLSYIPPVYGNFYNFDVSYNHLTEISNFPDSVTTLNISGNNTLSCLPQLKKFGTLDFSNTAVNCLPNLPENSDAVATPSLVGYPICSAGNPNGCIFFTPGTVWPGDADHNGVANNIDLLAIGQAYGKTGAVRAAASINWIGQTATDWSDTLHNGTNLKHTDCNGDGIINANDTTAIMQNYGLIHAKTDDESPFRAGDPTLAVSFSKDTLQAGDTVVISLWLGDAATPAVNVYGLAFNFSYDAMVIDSPSARFQFVNSWLGNNSNSIHIQKGFKTEGRVSAAITGIDHINRNGYGKIAEFIATITTGNINGKNLKYYLQNAMVDNVKAVDNNGNPVHVNAGSASSKVAYYPTGINDVSAAAQVQLFPNPARESCTVRITNEWKGASFRIMDVSGREMQKGVLNETINPIALSSLSSGIYFIEVNHQGLIQIQKLIKQ